MNNLTTRKITLGLLMVLVLAFSVQGVCEALTLSATSDTTQIKEPNDVPFELQFSVDLTRPTDINDFNVNSRHTKASVADIGYASGASTRADVSARATIITDTVYNANTPTTHYYTVTTTTVNTSITGVALTLTTNARNWATEVDADADTSRRYTRASAADMAAAGGTRADVSARATITTDATGNDAYTANDTHYYTVTTTTVNETITGVALTLTTNTRNWATESEAFYYNDEQISITILNSDGAAIDSTIGNPITLKNSNYVVPSGENLTERSGVLTSSMTLVCDISVAGSYTVTIKDSTDNVDYPPGRAPVTTGAGIRPSEIEFVLHVTTETVGTGNKIEAKTLTGGTTLYLRVDTGKAIEHIDDDFEVDPSDGDLEIRYKIISGNGTLYAAETSTTGIYRGPNQDLTVHQSANVFLNTNGTTNEVAASIAGSDRQTSTATIVYEYSGSGTGTGTPPPPPPPAANTITIFPSSIEGEPGEEVVFTVIPSSPSITVLLNSGDLDDGDFSVLFGSGNFPVTLTLPDEEGEYDFTATSPTPGYTPAEVSVTVESEEVALGTLSIVAAGAPSGGQQTIRITVRDSNGAPAVGAVNVTLRGTGIDRIVPTAAGAGAAVIPVPNTVAVSADGYSPFTLTLTGTGQAAITPPATPPATPTPTPADTGGEPDSISIVGPSTRSGTVNEALDTPLLVQVLDDDGDGLEGARVFYRVTGRGRISDGSRGGRSLGVVTDDDGYARANFTPTAGGSSTVRVSTDDVSRIVTFTITTGSAPTTRDAGTGSTPGASTTPVTISPVVHVVAASRPPMLWVDGGAIYGLVGASPQRFASSVDNALNITVAGGKVYWTEKTGESAGTINSANLNGSDVTELASIMAVPMGIAVDVAGSKLYWTNSRGRIQSANLNGSGITNVIPGGLESPMDLALAGGNAYWTQGNGSVRFANLRGQTRIRPISTGTDTPGSLVIGGGKVYWTETTGESGGTVNSANLNGTGATQLASILAAPIGIAVDGARSKLFWTNARGRVQSANLDGSGITNVVDGLGSPGDMVLSNSIAAPAATPTTPTPTTASNKYDVNGDGSVNNADSDAITVAIAAGATDAKYDVNGDGTVNVFDLVEIIANRDPGAAGAPTLFGMKMSAAQIDSLQEQIDLLIATNDRSPAAMRTLIYLQQLLVTARPEKTQLLANYPNPFNPETWIPYELATDTNVKVTIYNTQGVVIRTIPLGHQSGGYYVGRDRAAYWDGRNAFGEQVASGLYFYQLETDEMSSMRKMVILK